MSSFSSISSLADFNSMSSQISIEFRGSFLHVRLPQGFEITPQKMAVLWLTIGDACQVYDSKQVLVEGKVASRQMTVADVYESGKGIADIPRLRLACLFYDYISDETTDFFKMVAANRGAKVEFFIDRKEALRWLDVEADE